MSSLAGSIPPLRLVGCALLLGLLAPTGGRAEDAYRVVEIRALERTSGELPEDLDREWFLSRAFWGRSVAELPYAAIEGEGEAYYVWAPGGGTRIRRRSAPPALPAAPSLAVRAPAGREVRGVLVLPDDAEGKSRRIEFRLPPAGGGPGGGARESFLDARRAHYAFLLRRDLPGAAWFRHQVRTTSEQLGIDEVERVDTRRRFFGTERTSDLESTFSLLSGGRAVSENLQLDRLLPESAAGEADVPISSIRGITVRELDWGGRLGSERPEIDPLARVIPDDQHAVFFPSFEALAALADSATAHGTPIAQLAETRGEDARTRERYERQLGLSLDLAARLLGPQLVRSVAITGGDPYFRTGTDLAVVFETERPAELRAALEARVALSAKLHPRAEERRGETSGVAYRSWRTADRALSSHVAAIGGAVVVTNSPAQLERLASVAKGETPALGSLPEYAFFRARYRRAGERETAFLMISDRTIRRWCGPRWRIATSRRTRAAAVLAELQAVHADGIVRGGGGPAPLDAPYRVPDAGRLELSPSGISSSVYGSLAFLTPITELPIDRATSQEAELYARWRDGYERNWSNFFDPIALRIDVASGRIAADLTVMPLIDFSDYEELVAVSRGARLDPRAGDPHPEALAHVALALDPGSKTLEQYGAMAVMFVPHLQTNALSWLGRWIAVYADADPFWAELAGAPDETQFFEKNFHRLPIALHVGVESGARLTLFLTAVRAFIEQTAPGMAVWEPSTHAGRSFVRVAPSAAARARGQELERLAVYYAASGEGLILTLSRDVLERALERQAARLGSEAGAADAEKATEPTGNGAAEMPAWIGANLAARFGEAFFRVLGEATSQPYREALRERAWAALPILSEWKRRFPDRDPVEVHEELFKTRLSPPGAGEYRWNEEWQTMESSAYGHPGEPLAGPALPAHLEKLRSAAFGVTFEDDGLRARVELEERSASISR